MEPLHIPYLPALASCDSLADAARLLEEQGTRISIDSLNWPDQFPYHPLTTATLAHDGKDIYVDFFVRCNYLRAVNDTNMSPVHEDSCVEFFVAPEGRTPYINFECNCIGTISASRRTDRHNTTPLSDEELNSVRRYASCGNRPFEMLEGLFAWNLCEAIPMSLLGIEWKDTPVELMGNFYKCADRTSSPHFLSWAPISTPEPDFHRPEFFSKIILDA